MQRPLLDTEMRLVHGEIETREWNFAFDDPSELIGQIIAEAFEHNPPRIYLPFLYGDTDGHGGEKITDPLMMYLSLPLTSDEDCPAVYALSFRPLVYDFIDANRPGGEDGDALSGDDLVRAHLLTLALRTLADDIDYAAAHSKGELHK